MDSHHSGSQSVPGLAPPLGSTHPGLASFGTLAGATGPRIRFDRAAIFLVALIAADLVWIFADFLWRKVPTEDPFIWFFWTRAILADVVQVALILLFFRLIRLQLAATAAMAAAYVIAMLPLSLLLQSLFLEHTTFRFTFQPLPMFRNWVGTFLFFAAIVFIVPRIRSLWLCLTLGAAVGLIASNLAQWVFAAMEPGSFTTLESRLISFANSLGSALAFGTVFWAGLKALGFSPGESPAFDSAAHAGVPAGRAGQLQHAANFRTIRRLLRPAGIGSILFGVIAVGLGASTIEANPLNAVLLFLGLFLLIEGIWLVVSPSPVGILVDGFALCALGLWNIFITMSNFSAGARGPAGFAALGVFQIVLGIQSFRRYGRYADWPMQKPSEADLQFLDAALKSPANSISVRLGQGRSAVNWKAALLESFAVFVEEKEERTIVAPRENISITPLSTASASDVSVRISAPGLESDGSISTEALDRFNNWKSARP